MHFYIDRLVDVLGSAVFKKYRYHHSVFVYIVAYFKTAFVTYGRPIVLILLMHGVIPKCKPGVTDYSFRTVLQRHFQINHLQQLET